MTSVPRPARLAAAVLVATALAGCATTPAPVPYSGGGTVAAPSLLSAVTGTLGADAASWFGSRTRHEVTVRSDDGIDRAFKLDELPSFRSGAKVRVDGGRLVADG